MGIVKTFRAIAKNNQNLDEGEIFVPFILRAATKERRVK